MYEVYVCKHNDVIVYIGKGTKGRHKHCISGCSHVFELNKIFFTEGVDSLDVVVIDGGFTYNTIVEWSLADFLDDKPPFVEVNFNERCEGDTMYFTSNLDEMLYEFNGMLFMPTDGVIL